MENTDKNGEDHIYEVSVEKRNLAKDRLQALQMTDKNTLIIPRILNTYNVDVSGVEPLDQNLIAYNLVCLDHILTTLYGEDGEATNFGYTNCLHFDPSEFTTEGLNNQGMETRLKQILKSNGFSKEIAIAHQHNLGPNFPNPSSSDPAEQYAFWFNPKNIAVVPGEVVMSADKVVILHSQNFVAPYGHNAKRTIARRILDAI